MSDTERQKAARLIRMFRQLAQANKKWAAEEKDGYSQASYSGRSRAYRRAALLVAEDFGARHPIRLRGWARKPEAEIGQPDNQNL